MWGSERREAQRTEVGWKDCGALEVELERQKVMGEKMPTTEVLERRWLLRQGRPWEAGAERRAGQGTEREGWQKDHLPGYENHQK